MASDVASDMAMQRSAASYEADPPEPSTSGNPQYLLPTHVMPKKPLQEYKNAGQEFIHYAFSTVSMTGIRSLPDAMANDFRQRLFEQMIESQQAERQGMRIGSFTSSPGSPGMRIGSFTSSPGDAFSSTEYIPSEYGRLDVLNKFERLRSKCAQVNPTDFVVALPPQGPKGTPSFSVYESTREPFLPKYEVECAEERANKQGILAGPFVTGRRVDKLSLLRGRADECMFALCKLLSRDWPSAFLQVFEDVSGGIVVSFDATRAIVEGDLSAYMQHLARNNNVVSEYHLQKDGTQWGVVDEETQSAFYLLWPPWVRHRYKAPPRS